MTLTVDEAIGQIESLYKSVTGREAPPPTEAPFATIPPEKDPETHIGEQIDRLLNSLSEVGERPVARIGWTPSISVWHGTDEMLIHVDLPGVKRDAVRVRLTNGALQVSGSRPSPSPEKHTARYAEHPFGTFMRMIPIPAGVSVEQLQAQLTDGVLVIRLPGVGGRMAEEKDIAVS